jgi:hypothetical protein
MAAAGANLKIKIPTATAGSNTSAGSNASIMANRNAFQRMLAAEVAAEKAAAAAAASSSQTTLTANNNNNGNNSNNNNNNGLPFKFEEEELGLPIGTPIPKYTGASTTASLASMTPRSGGTGSGSPLSFSSAPGSMGGRRRRSRKGKSKKSGHRKSKKAIRRKRSTRRR